MERSSRPEKSGVNRYAREFRGDLLKRQSRPFIVERRSIPARTFAQYAAQPDDIAELHAAADELQNVPRHWLDSRQDMCHGLRRTAGRLRKIADRLAIIEPIAKKHAAPKLARIADRHDQRAGRKAPGQLEMSL